MENNKNRNADNTGICQRKRRKLIGFFRTVTVCFRFSSGDLRWRVDNMKQIRKMIVSIIIIGVLATLVISLGNCETHAWWPGF